MLHPAHTYVTNVLGNMSIDPQVPGAILALFATRIQKISLKIRRFSGAARYLERYFNARPLSGFSYSSTEPRP